MDSIQQVSKVEITPINNTNDGVYSHDSGSPQIVFQIAKQAGFLVPNSVRVNFDVKSVGAFSESIGVASAFNQVTLMTHEGQTIENIKNYNQFLSTILPIPHSSNDYCTTLQSKFLVGSSPEMTSLMSTQKTGVSMPLMTGFMNSGTPVPLNMLGLELNLELAPSSLCLKVTGSDITPTCELSNVTLSYDVLIPDEKGMEDMAKLSKGAIAYNSVQTLYSVNNSSDSTIDLNLQGSNVKSVFSKYVPTNFLNNKLQDSLKMYPLKDSNGDSVNVSEVSFMRNGVKFPLEESLDVRDLEAQTGDKPCPQVPIVKNFVNSVIPLKNLNHSTISLNNLQSEIYVDTDVDGNNPIANTQDGKTDIFGIGVNCDDFSSVGVNMKGATFSQRVVSGLDGTSPNSCFTFVLNKNVLQFSPQGVAVST